MKQLRVNRNNIETNSGINLFLGRNDPGSHATAFVTPVMEHWLEQELLNESTMRDWSDDLSHQEQSYIHILLCEIISPK